jgi:Tol biopolymer transport system component
VTIALCLALLSSCGTSTTSIVNPTPSITGLFPSSVTAGSQNFTMFVAGQNLLNGKTAGTRGLSAVYWNGAVRTSTYNNDTQQLAVNVLASDVATAGIAQVTVVNPTPGGGPSPAATFTILPVQPNTPLITSISPTSATLGSDSVAITVNGTNFQSNSVIAFNGGPLCPTTIVSPTQLTATIDKSLLVNSQTASITVYTPTGGGGNLFSPGIAFTVGTPPTSNNLTFPQVVSVSALGGASDGPSEAPALSYDGRYVAFYSQAKNLVREGAYGNIFVRDTCINVTGACIQSTTAIDLAPEGTPANGKGARQLSLSGDGRYVAFVSRATNLMGEPTSNAGASAAASGFPEIYVRDLCNRAPSGCTPQTVRITIAADGSTADGPSSHPSLSSDGRYVAFASSATNLVAGAVHSGPQIYVRDTCTGATAAKNCVAQTYAVAMDDADRAAFAQGARPVISATGRYVAYEAWTGTEAAAAGAPGAEESAEVVVADTCLGSDVAAGCKPTATRVSLSSEASNFAPSISADGRYVAFESQPISANGASSTGSSGSTVSHVYVRDTCLGAVSACTPSTSAVSADALTLAAGRTESYSPSISANGRYVSFIAGSSAAGSTTEGTLEVRDMCFGAGKGCVVHSYAANDTGTISTGCQSGSTNTTSASVATGGVTADKYTAVPLSANGRLAAFYAPESTPAQPANGVGDIFLTNTPF